jgi:hypothetical protein
VKINQKPKKTNEAFDLVALSKEPETLRTELLKQAKEPEQVIMAGDVAQAEIAAQNGDESKTLEYLKNRRLDFRDSFKKKTISLYEQSHKVSFVAHIMKIVASLIFKRIDY